MDAAKVSINPSTPTRRRGPSLSRRTGQSGIVVQHSKTWNPGAPCYGKFTVDIPGGPRKRRTIAMGIFATKSKARSRLREFIEREGVNSWQSFHQYTAPATTFREQAERGSHHFRRVVASQSSPPRFLAGGINSTNGYSRLSATWSLQRSVTPP